MESSKSVEKVCGYTNGMGAKGKRKSTVLKVGKVFGREVDGDFHGNGG